MYCSTQGYTGVSGSWTASHYEDTSLYGADDNCSLCHHKDEMKMMPLRAGAAFYMTYSCVCNVMMFEN